MRPEDKLLPLLRGVVEIGPGKWKALCPCHDDSDPSLEITKAADGKLLLHCFPCGNRNAAEFCYAVGLTLADLYPEDLQRHIDGGRVGKSGKGSGIPRDAKKTAEFFYRDAQGIVLYRVDRYEWLNEKTGVKDKAFQQKRPNGEGGWVPSVKGVQRVLYRLPELIVADAGQTVFIVEGEKKVEALRNWGLTATCIAGGAKSKWIKAFTDSLRGRHVVILPDNDPIDQNTGACPGRDFAVTVLRALDGAAASQKIVELPGLPPKGDIVDWQSAGHTKDELLALVSAATPEATAAAVQDREQTKASAPARDPLSTHVEEEIVAALGLEVLGEIEGTLGNVKIFSKHHRKSERIADISKLSYERLVQLAGPIVKAKVTRGSDDEPPPGVYRMMEVRSAIGLLAGFRRLGDDSEAGPGCWQGQDDAGSPTESIVVVGAGEAAIWNGTGSLERIQEPRADGRLLDIGSSDSWYDFGNLSALLTGCTPEFAHETAMQAEGLFERWRWRADDSPMVVSGLIMATWVQTIWAWRPQVAIIGRSNSGKSTLFEALDGIFGRLAVKSSQSSAAGIRQSIRQSAGVILADEFESGKHRHDILEMLRASSRGDKVLRGTTGHRGQEFSLRHIAWVAAIESGLSREPDRNRFITLELLPPTKENAGKLVLPPTAELAELGQRLLAVSIRYGLAAASLAVRLKSRRFDGVHPRVIESYAVPAAMHAALRGITNEDEASGILGRLLKTADLGDNATGGDEESLMADILSSSIRMDRGMEATVAQAVVMAKQQRMEAEEALERHGVGLFIAEEQVNGGRLYLGDYLFVAHNIVTRKLLNQTNWRDQRIDQILCRIEGAGRCKKRIGNMHPWGVMIPMSYIDGGGNEESGTRNTNGTLIGTT